MLEHTNTNTRNPQPRILIVDDQEANTRLLERILIRAGYNALTSVNDSTQVISVFMSLQPDLILLDWMMPNMNGFELMQKLMPLILPGIIYLY